MHLGHLLIVQLLICQGFILPFYFFSFCFHVCFHFPVSFGLFQHSSEFSFDLSVVFLRISLCIAFSVAALGITFDQFMYTTPLYISLPSTVCNCLKHSSMYIWTSSDSYNFCFNCKCNLENSRGERKSIVFTHTFAYLVLSSFLTFQGFFFVSFLFRECPLVTLLGQVCQLPILNSLTFPLIYFDFPFSPEGYLRWVQDSGLVLLFFQLLGWRSRLLPQPLLVGVGVGHSFLCAFTFWCLAGVWLLSKSFPSCWLPLSWSCGQREQSFVGNSWCFWVARIFSAKSGM